MRDRPVENRKKKSLKWKLVSIMFLYWLLPFLVIISTIGIYMLTSQEKSQMERLTGRAEMNSKVCAERLEGAVADSRQATYDGVIYEAYRKYRREEISERAFFKEAQAYLEIQYSHKQNNSVAVLMLKDDPLNKKCSSYNFGTGGSYEQIQTFFGDDCGEVLEYAEGLDTAVGFLLCEDRLYLVRNMVDKHFRPWGILANRVYLDYCFETLNDFQSDFNIRAELNGEAVVSTGKKDLWENTPELAFSGTASYIFDKDQMYTFYRVKDRDFNLDLTLNERKARLFQPLYGYLYIALIMVLFLIPMLLLFFRMSGKYVSHPVERMMDGAEEIVKGNLGIQVEGDTGSKEFEYLRESFNHMSTRLKYQFDHIYEEELALRDAKIMALQSHINPHFMNNTLEIINWEARLCGNEKVSKMIGSLSTLMDAAIDRKKLPEVSLSEEMHYVNAYLYITSERLGKRLAVEKELPGECMKLMVPRLIMQPIIENAIEHGIVPRGSGRVRIQGRREGAYLYLEVINDGEFSPEDEMRVKRLLAPDYDTSKEPSGNMGIANVNQRLRILYGESAGLSIARYEEDQTISTLTILVSN